ncbi:MAG: MFS transporter [Chloroflexota bacterium]
MTTANKIVALVLSCCIFFAAGIISSLLGPVLPSLAANTGSTLAATGSVISAIFMGALITQFALGPVNDRVGPRPVLIVCLAVGALGLVALSASTSLLFAFLSALMIGMGMGAMVISPNVMLAVVFASRSVSALNFANVFYGVGAVCGPAIASLLASITGSPLPALLVAATLLAVLSPACLLLKVPRTMPHQHEDGVVSASVYRAPALWALAVVLLIYVGTESGVSSWAITYLNRTTSLELASAGFVLSGFWLTLTGGRLLGAIVGARLGAHNLLTVSFSGAVLGAVLLLVSSGSASLMIAALLILGFSIGPVYPTVVSLATTTFHKSPGKAASFVMGMGSVGGMLLPWLLGVLLEWQGVYGSIALIVACGLAMLLLHVGPRLVSKRVEAGTA